jgi:hypothetical protein
VCPACLCSSAASGANAVHCLNTTTTSGLRADLLFLVCVCWCARAAPQMLWRVPYLLFSLCYFSTPYRQRRRLSLIRARPWCATRPVRMPRVGRTATAWPTTACSTATWRHATTSIRPRCAR